MARVLHEMHHRLPKFQLEKTAVNCHHNYVQREEHFGQSLLVTRKGAVSARAGELGIIPGSMGAKSFIVRGKGNPDSFCSCSHGAGRKMSRTAARQRITLKEHREATAHVECRKDEGVIDESPRRLQGHRRGDGGAERSGRSGTHPASGGVHQGVRGSTLARHCRGSCAPNASTWMRGPGHSEADYSSPWTASHDPIEAAPCAALNHATTQTKGRRASTHGVFFSCETNHHPQQ